MSSEPARIVICPQCKKRMQYTTTNAHRPFCSERCRLIDFGAWVNEEHRVPGDAPGDELMSGDLPPEQ